MRAHLKLQLAEVWKINRLAPRFLLSSELYNIHVQQLFDVVFNYDFLLVEEQDFRAVIHSLLANPVDYLCKSAVFPAFVLK